MSIKTSRNGHHSDCVCVLKKDCDELTTTPLKITITMESRAMDKQIRTNHVCDVEEKDQLREIDQGINRTTKRKKEENERDGDGCYKN